jgi:hypothetical protein
MIIHPKSKGHAATKTQYTFSPIDLIKLGRTITLTVDSVVYLTMSPGPIGTLRQ